MKKKELRIRELRNDAGRACRRCRGVEFSMKEMENEKRKTEKDFVSYYAFGNVKGRR
jgi:hypothetical protein